MTATDGSTVLRWAGLTDVGMVRSNNQDRYMLRPEAQLWVVADGMGGHRGGEVASQLACEEMARSYRARTVDGLVEAVSAANRTVYDAGMADPDLRGMGTTVVALAVVEGDELDQASGAAPDGEVLAIANVGDSRAYRFTTGELEQLTEDHSLVADLVREGSLSPDEAESHPQRNILTRVLGVYDDIPVDVVTVTPHPGDRYLLCSDGLFNEVSESGIAAVLRRLDDPEDAAAELVRLALEGGARDNTTVVVVDVLDDGGGGGPVGPTSGATATIDTGPGISTAEVPAMGPTPSGAPDPPTTDPPPGSASGPFAEPESNGSQNLAVSDPDGQDDGETGAAGRRSRRAARRERRRARPRRFTWRVFLFIILLGVVLGGAFATIEWYGRGAYYVGFDEDQVVIYRGRPGGVLWIGPEEVETTPLDRSVVPADQVGPLESGREYASLSDAEAFVDRLQDRSESLADDERTGDRADDDPAGGGTGDRRDRGGDSGGSGSDDGGGTGSAGPAAPGRSTS